MSLKSRLLQTILFLNASINVCSCYRSERTDVQQEIQIVLDQEFKGKFKIIKIEKNFSKDFLHEQTGYSIWLEGDSAIKFGPVFFEKNKQLKKWIPYMGSDISSQYEKAKKLYNN